MNKSVATNALIIAALALVSCLTTGCSDRSPVGPEFPGDGSSHNRILVLEDGGTEARVIQQLRANGFDVRSGGLFYEFTGDGLDWADAVVLLTGVDYNHDMDDRGEAALVSFVAEGGGLMTTEWLSYSIERTDYHRIIANILPVSYGNFYANGKETWSVLVDHPVTQGLSTFTTPTDSQFSSLVPRSGATRLISASRSAAAVTTWTKGGRVVSWSTAGAYGGDNFWNAELNRLLVNTVEFISGRSN